MPESHEVEDADTAMELDHVDETEGASRPATSAASEASAPDNNTLDEQEEEDSTRRPDSLPEKGTPLTDSYTYMSPRPTAEGPYAVGVDEAGRGPALGPLVYGMAFCPVSFMDDELGSMGFDGQLNCIIKRGSFHLIHLQTPKFLNTKLAWACCKHCRRILSIWAGPLML